MPIHYDIQSFLGRTQWILSLVTAKGNVMAPLDIRMDLRKSGLQGHQGGTVGSFRKPGRLCIRSGMVKAKWCLEHQGDLRVSYWTNSRLRRQKERLG